MNATMKPRAWLCELAEEDGTTRTQFVEEDPNGLRWNDWGEPSPYRTTPLLTMEQAAQMVDAERARIAASLRRSGATLPAPEVKGTPESGIITGLCIALTLVESGPNVGANRTKGADMDETDAQMAPAPLGPVERVVGRPVPERLGARSVRADASLPMALRLSAQLGL